MILSCKYEMDVFLLHARYSFSIHLLSIENEIAFSK